MFHPAKFGRLIVLGRLCGGFSLTMAAEADAGIFGRNGRAFRGNSGVGYNRSVNVGRGRGYAVRGPADDPRQQRQLPPADDLLPGRLPPAVNQALVGRR